MESSSLSESMDNDMAINSEVMSSIKNKLHSNENEESKPIKRISEKPSQN